jgi:hypothetical protein
MIPQILALRKAPIGTGREEGTRFRWEKPSLHFLGELASCCSR